MTPIDNLLTPLTTAEAKKSIYDTLAILGVSTTNWKAGAVVRTIITACAVLIAACSRMIAVIGRSGFLSTAQGEWHQHLALEVYGVENREATFAATTWVANNSGGGSYSLSPGDLVVQNSVTKKQYYNTSGVLIDPLETNVSISIAAFEAGSESNAGAGDIDELITNLPGVSGSNPQAAVALDEMKDEERTQLCKAKTIAVSPNGAREAYEYVAMTATRTDGSNVGINRVNPMPDLMGGVLVYIASSSGAVPDADVEIVDEAIQRYATPLAVTSIVESATPLLVPITYEVWLRNTGGLTEANVQFAIETSLRKFFATEPIGGHRIGVASNLYRSAIIAAIGAAEDEGGTPIPIFRVEVTNPGSDVPVMAHEVTTLGTLVGAVHLL